MKHPNASQQQTQWFSHTKAKVKAMWLHWFLILSNLPATPSKSDFPRDVAGSWVQNPFYHDFSCEIAFAQVWLDHKR